MADISPASTAPHPTTDRPAWLGAYYMQPTQAGALRQWPALLDRVAALGLSTVVLASPFAGASVLLLDDPGRLHPALQWDGGVAEGLAFLDAACRARKLDWMLDLRLDRVAHDGAVARAQPDLFVDSAAEVVDPRRGAPAALARLPERHAGLVAWWAERIAGWLTLGAAGMRLDALERLPPAFVRDLIGGVRAEAACRFIGGIDRLPTDRLPTWTGCGLDAIGLSLDGWDFAADWFWARHDALARVAPVLIEIERPFGPRLASHIAAPAQRQAALIRAVGLAGAFGDGILLPMGSESGATRPLDPRAAAPMAVMTADLSLLPNLSLLREPGQGAARHLAGAARATLAFVRGSGADARLSVINTDLLAAHSVDLAAITHDLGVPSEPVVTLAPGAAHIVTVAPEPPILLARPAPAEGAALAARGGRIAIEAVTPSVDDGAFPARRTVGDMVTVACDVICEGHDQLSVLLAWRAADRADWHETRMTPLGNDRWQAQFRPSRLGRWEFRVQAWRDAFASFRDELTKKYAAGLDVRLEVIEGQRLVEAAGLAVAKGGEIVGQVRVLLSDEVARLVQQADTRPLATVTQPFPVDAERLAARFASWYEVFPRSMSDDEQRHGTFRDVIRQLPRIRDMGFDVLYFPPIHPIGGSNRKGRNNALKAGPDDPGSPYAIGSADGGHDAIHPQLGTLDDFRALREAAAGHGLELALDFAIQCSPDHPWLREHKGWFDWRPDGSLRYAENPPKKYEDIVNVDFYAADAVPGLWVALRDAVLFWVEQGVRVFRVDNPHTKPFPFWQWLIDDIRAQYPDTMFLAEAFTRPKVMARLAKVGFGQSYTYFTWRNTRAEMETYLTELASGATADFFQPNFFVNTPDINPVFLQTSGRAGFLIRAALAATLAGLWGVYSGFELCEGTPMPGREEYLNSEKYQLRAWDWQRPGNIVPEVTRLNRIRRNNAALQTHLGVTFLPSDNPMVMFFEKATADRANVVLVAISFDPFQAQSAAIELPLYRWPLPDSESLACEDLLGDNSFTLAGKYQRVTLSPDAPYVVWRAQPVS